MFGHVNTIQMIDQHHLKRDPGMDDGMGRVNVRSAYRLTKF